MGINPYRGERTRCREDAHCTLFYALVRAGEHRKAPMMEIPEHAALKKQFYLVIMEEKNMEGIKSKNWKNWRAFGDLKTCIWCRDKNGKIYRMDEMPDPAPPLHPHCRCVMERMRALTAGTATRDGKKGADFWLKKYGKLPENYITKKKAKELGWKNKGGNLADIAPRKTIFGVVYQNKKRKLPDEFGRIWYEADFNYTNGYRIDCRILFSSDGLIFVTYDHYETFYEII